MCDRGEHSAERDTGGGNDAPTPSPASVLAWPFLVLIRLYQLLLSPLFALLGAHCRFTPTCSRYAIEAYTVHGPLRGTLLTIKRLARCHPWGGSGDDPVPARKN
jgi:putative membrane protein insertion efficiency factor